MKKWFVLALIVCVAAAVQAGEGKKKGKGKGGAVTKEKFVAQAKARAEKKGTEFDQAKVEKMFDKKDVNKDGKLSAEEKAKKGGHGKKKKSAE